jgi:uroporphyrinogen decarboxylase
MTPRERLIAAANHRATDFTPYHVEYSAGIKAAMIRELGTENLAGATGDHLSRYSTRGKWEEIRPGFVRDDFGVVWDRSADQDIGVPEAVLTTPDLGRVQWPTAESCGRLIGAEAFVQRTLAAGGFCCLGMALSLFERAWALRGMESLLLDMMDEPSFVDDLLDRIVEHNLSVMRTVAHLPWDGVWIGDDWGQQRGLIMGRKLWRRFILPRARRMYEYARAQGWIVIIHSCGDVVELLPDLIEAGVQVLNPFQPEVMDLVAVKKQFGRDLAFLGGMSVQRTLPFGTPREVREQSRWLLEKIGAGSGFIFAPSHMMTDDVPVANVLAMLEVIAAANPVTRWFNARQGGAALEAPALSRTAERLAQ